MPRLMGKIVLTAGSALIAGVLLVVAYVSGGAAALAFLLSAVFLIGGNVVPVHTIFAPVGFAALVIFAAASWGLATLGIGAWWLWKPKRRKDDDKAGTPP